MPVELRERVVDVLAGLHLGQCLRGRTSLRGGRGITRSTLDHMDGMRRLDLVGRERVLVLQTATRDPKTSY